MDDPVGTSGGRADVRCGGRTDEHEGARSTSFDALMALESRLQALEQQLQGVERVLSESEERFILITDGANNGSWDWDPSTNQVYCSPRLLELLRTEDRGPAPAENCLNWVHADHRERIGKEVLAFFLDSRATKLHTEHRIACSDGSTIWVLSSAVAVRDSEGRVVRMVGSVTDISERKRFEEQLRESEQRYRTLAENFPNGGILMFDHDLRYTVADGQGLALVGLSRDAIVGKTLSERWPPDLVATLDPVYRSALAGHPSVLEVPLADRLYETHVLPVRAEHGQVVAGMVVALDMTERRRSEDSLRASEAKFRALAETVSTAIFIFQGVQLLYVNPAAVAITGYSSEELCGMRFWDIIDPEFQERVRARGLARQAGEAVPLRYEVKVRTKAGEARWVDFAAGTIEYGGELAVLGTAVDITDRKRAEEALRRREQELTHVARVHTIGEMATSLAHELNQPLGAIAAYAQGCIRRLQTADHAEAELVDALGQIAEQSMRAAEIIRSLRHLVRKGDPHRRRVDVNALVEEAIRFAEPEARRMEVQLRCELGGDLAAVEADDVQIEQVILNLVRNACEAVRAANSSPAEVIIRTESQGDRVQIAVADCGDGIAPDVTDRIFEPFFTKRANGLGMGLSISRTIVEAHGGRIWVTANPDGGVTFRFTLAAVPAAVDA